MNINKLIIILILLSLILSFPISILARDRIGVDIPFQITNQYPERKHQITDGQFLLYTYEILLNRQPDDAGGLLWIKQLDNGTSRLDIFKAFMESAEFNTMTGLNDDGNYLTRLYQYMYKRTPDSAGYQANLNALKSWESQMAREAAWYQLFTTFLSYPEFENVNCTNQIYSYGTKLISNAPSLEDLFTGAAKFQPLSQAEKINLDFSGTEVSGIWDQKLPIIKSENGSVYTGFSRGYLNNDTFDIFILTSNDGISFNQAKRIFNDRNNSMSLYDPHISIDYSFCPQRYVMTMECAGLCISESSTPEYSWSWSKPKPIVNAGKFNNRYLFASTGTSITDIDGKRYVYWTVLDDGPNWFETPSHQRLSDDGDESTYTKGSEMSRADWTSNPDGGTTLMKTEQNVHCNSSWDCNNKDKQDIKYESGNYYIAYNGANYYRCVRPDADRLNGYKSDWGLSLARSKSPLGNFDADRLGKLIDSENKETCGISYPLINEINGELYLYYAYYPNVGGNITVRSKLVWNSPTPTVTSIPPYPTSIPPTLTNNPSPTSPAIATAPAGPTAAPILGDISGPSGIPDGKVDIYDYNQLISEFGKRGANGWIKSDLEVDGVIDIFDYNILVGNFGK